MVTDIDTGPGEVFFEGATPSAALPIIEKRPLPPIIEYRIQKPPVSLPSSPAASAPVPPPSPPALLKITHRVPYTQPQYDYWKPPSSLRTFNINRNVSSQKVIVPSRPITRMELLKQLLLFSFGFALTGIPLAVVTTYYLEQQGPCPTTTTVTTTTSTTATTATTTTALPSQCFTYTTINDSTRSVLAGAGALCDNTLASGWYRFVGNGTMLATTYVSRDTCTTWYGGNYNGTMPTTPGTTAYGTLCANNNGYLCYATYSGSAIVVTNCDSYYVFYLTPITTCNSRYCTTN